MTRRELMEKRLWDYGQWSGHVTEAGKYGNSPSAKIEEIGRTGLNSPGTAYLDRSSDTMHVPERHREIHACLQFLPQNFARVFNAAYVLFIDEHTPKRRHKFIRAHYAGLSLEAFYEVKDELTTVMLQLEDFIFGGKQ